MGIAAEYLMRDFNFAALDLVSLRLLGAGVMLLAFEALRGQRIFGDFTRDGHWKAISVYGFIMLGVQATFFLAIAASNTATAALMVTTLPIFVAGWKALAEKRQLTRNEKISVGLAVIGVACIVTRGAARYDRAFLGRCAVGLSFFCLRCRRYASGERNRAEGFRDDRSRLGDDDRRRHSLCGATSCACYRKLDVARGRAVVLHRSRRNSGGLLLLS